MYFCAQFIKYKLIKKGGGTGPMKPWQPLPFQWKKVPNPIRQQTEKISCDTGFPAFFML